MSGFCPYLFFNQCHRTGGRLSSEAPGKVNVAMINAINLKMRARFMDGFSMHGPVSLAALGHLLMLAR